MYLLSKNVSCCSDINCFVVKLILKKHIVIDSEGEWKIEEIEMDAAVSGFVCLFRFFSSNCFGRHDGEPERSAEAN